MQRRFVKQEYHNNRIHNDTWTYIPDALHYSQQKNDPHFDDDVDHDILSPSDPLPAKRAGRKRIKIEYIEDKNRRHITFSKRKAGIMKKVLWVALGRL